MTVGFGKAALAFVVAFVATHIVGAAAAAQHVINAFGAMAEPVSLGERLLWTLRDIKGMALDGALPIFPIALLVALLLGFVVAGLIVRRRPALRVVGFTLAGFVALIAAHLVLHAAAELHPVAASRTVLGLLAQGLAGAIGGYVYARLTRAGPLSG